MPSALEWFAAAREGTVPTLYTQKRESRVRARCPGCPVLSQRFTAFEAPAIGDLELDGRTKRSAAAFVNHDERMPRAVQVAPRNGRIRRLPAARMPIGLQHANRGTPVTEVAAVRH
jgi:hypothetical protein